MKPEDQPDSRETGEIGEGDLKILPPDQLHPTSGRALHVRLVLDQPLATHRAAQITDGVTEQPREWRPSVPVLYQRTPPCRKANAASASTAGENRKP